jgi:hypothetical protein
LFTEAVFKTNPYVSMVGIQYSTGRVTKEEPFFGSSKLKGKVCEWYLMMPFCGQFLRLIGKLQGPCIGQCSGQYITHSYVKLKKTLQIKETVSHGFLTLCFFLKRFPWVP